MAAAQRAARSDEEATAAGEAAASEPAVLGLSEGKIGGVSSNIVFRLKSASTAASSVPASLHCVGKAASSCARAPLGNPAAVVRAQEARMAKTATSTIRANEAPRQADAREPELESVHASYNTRDYTGRLTQAAHVTVYSSRRAMMTTISHTMR